MTNNYPIKGTFIDEITYDIPSNNWSHEQWAKDLDYMKEVGIDSVIFIRGFFYNKCLFPSKHFAHIQPENEDFAGFILEECEKRNMKVYFGLYIENLTWNDGDAKNEIAKNKIFIDEVVERYHKYKSFYGWYIPHEVGKNDFNITEIFRELGKMCKEKTPNKPVIASPFFYAQALVKEGWLTPKEMASEWDKILELSGHYIDAYAFQDGSASLNLMTEYYKELRPVFEKHGAELWGNIEMMQRGVTGFFPIDFTTLQYKISQIAPYVSNMITFEFSHFLSPQSTFGSAKNLYNLYKNHYNK